MPAAANAQPLNLVCRRADLDTIVEGQFLRDVLLGRLRRPLRVMPMEAGQDWPAVDGCLLLVLGYGADYETFLTARRDAGHRNVGILHMADEKGLVDCAFYGLARYVLRNYYFPDRLDPEGRRGPPVIWIPNGYANGVGPVEPERLPGFAERQHLVFFSGNVSGADGEYPERVELFGVVKSHGLSSVMAATQGFASGFGRVSFGAHLANTKFAPVPGGMSPESIRLYDALENGAIPVALRTDYVGAPDALDNPPFPVLDSWRELPALVGPAAEGDAGVLAHWEARRLEIAEWWRTFKRRHAERVAGLVEASFGAKAC